MKINWTKKPSLLDVNSETPQNWHSLKIYLSQQNIDFEMENWRPRQFSSGFGNLNYLIKIDGKFAVLRRPPLGVIPPGANDMKREHRILSRLYRAFPLAPKSIHYCESHEILGNHFIIMDYREGATIGGQLPDQINKVPGIPLRLTKLLVDILVELHAVNPNSIDLGEFGKPEGFLSRAVSGWRKRLFLATDNTPSKAALDVAEWLEKNIVADGPATLLHNDFKLDNIILNTKSLNPVAVVDWDMGSRGDPLFDLATLLSYWVEADDPPAMKIIKQMPSESLNFPKRKDVIELYAMKSGRDLDQFKFYRVLTQFKLAVVFAQIDAQYRRGTTTDKRFGKYSEHISGMFEFALDIAMGKIN